MFTQREHLSQKVDLVFCQLKLIKLDIFTKHEKN